MILQEYTQRDIATKYNVYLNAIQKQIKAIQNKAITLFGETFEQNFENMMKKDVSNKRNTSRQELRYSEK